MGRMERSAHEENMLSAARAGKFTKADLEAACAIAAAGALKGAKLQAAAQDTQRSDELRQRRAEQGLQEVRGAWAHPDDHAAVKKYAAKLQRKRNAQST